MLDLNGYELTVSSDVSTLENSGTLTVKNGTVSALDGTTTGMAVDNLSDGRLTVEQDDGQTTRLIGRNGIRNSGKATICGGTIESYNQDAISAAAGSTTTVWDGTVSSPDVRSGYGRALYSEGTVYVYGGTFSASGSTGNGDNYMIAIGVGYETATLTIQPAEGKTVTVTSATDYAVSSRYGAEVHLRGGSYACNGDRVDVLNLDEEYGDVIHIYGGTFRHEPYDAYLADGYISVEENGSYVVGALQTSTDMTVDSYEALAAALGGSVLTPLDITLSGSVTIPAGADLTLQRGYTLTIPADSSLTVDGILRLRGAMVNNGTLAVTEQGFLEYPLKLTNNGAIAGYPAVEDGVCTISTPMQLQWLTCMVERQNDQIPSKIQLASDLVMPDVEFIPIGNSSPYHTSTFDGGGHTISNLHVVVTSEYQGGLFGTMRDATVKNLTISGTSTNSTNSYIGALAGRMNGSCFVQNVHIRDYKVYSPISYGVGGFVGQISSDDASDRFEFIGCTLNASVTGYANQGGIWGTSTGSLGTIGIYNCTLAGTVTTINVNGGICGGFGSSAPVEIIGLDHSGLTVTVNDAPTDKLVAYTTVAHQTDYADGDLYDAVKAPDGSWTYTTAGTVAVTVDGIPYTSFAAAVAAAEDGGIVNVEQPVTLTEAVSISKPVTVTGFDRISVGTGGSLTISAGTYDADPTPYVADTLVGKYNSDGTYTVVELTADTAVAACGRQIFQRAARRHCRGSGEQHRYAAAEHCHNQQHQHFQGPDPGSGRQHPDHPGRAQKCGPSADARLRQHHGCDHLQRHHPRPVQHRRQLPDHLALRRGEPDHPDLVVQANGGTMSYKYLLRMDPNGMSVPTADLGAGRSCCGPTRAGPCRASWALRRQAPIMTTAPWCRRDMKAPRW